MLAPSFGYTYSRLKGILHEFFKFSTAYLHFLPLVTLFQHFVEHSATYTKISYHCTSFYRVTKFLALSDVEL